MSGISRSRQGMLNLAIALAAFGFVAFILVFVHPAARTQRTAAQQASAGSGVATASTMATGAHSHLAASK